MSQSLSRIYLHIVFSTKSREPWLDGSDLQKALHAYLGATMTQLDCLPVEIGGVEDHLHLLCLFPRTRSVADVVKETKRVSTKWLQAQSPELKGFHWQGVAIERDDVVEYIRRRKHAVEFDKRYVWD